MQFKINDIVQYGATGVCKITGIEKKVIMRQEKAYYVLQPMFSNNSVVYVPADNAALLAKMQRLLNADEIYTLIGSITEDEDIWIEDKQQRQAAYRALLQQGDRGEIIKMIKAMYLQEKRQQQKGKKLHLADEKLYKTAQKVLYDEFAFVLHMQPEEIVPLIVRELEPKR